MDKRLKKSIPLLIVGFLFFYIGNRISYIWTNTLGTTSADKSLNFIKNIKPYFIGGVSLDGMDLLIGGLCMGVALLAIFIKASESKKFRKGEEHGSAQWGTKKDIAPFLPTKPKNKVLLSDTEALMINEKPEHPKNQRNLNVLLVGGTGSGKTRFFVKPNLLQMNSSYIVTDSKGSIMPETAQMFQDNGYKIKIFNLIDMNESMRYNPFEYIETESDILKFVDVLIANTTNDHKTGGDPFWEDSERLLLTAYIAYMFEHKETLEDYNFKGLLKMINDSQIKVGEDGNSIDNEIDKKFKVLEKDRPDSLAVSQYRKYKTAPPKTAGSILISVATRLQPFDLEEVKDLTARDELKLNEIGNEKTILYIILPDSNTTFNFLAGMMYSQLFDVLMYEADSNPSHKLDIPIQMYLDEFANIGTIPNFEKIIATIRSRGISAVIILQSLAQLKSKYKDNADTIIGNCDTKVFLGGNETTTLKEISQQLGKETIDDYNTSTTKSDKDSYGQNYSKLGRDLMAPDELAVMDNSKCIVSIRGLRPFKSNKIDLESHPNYPYISDSDDDGKRFDSETYIANIRLASDKLNQQKKKKRNNTKAIKDMLPENFELSFESEDGELERYTFNPDMTERGVIEISNITL